MERSNSPYDRQEAPNFQQAASLTVMLPPESAAANDIPVVHPIIVSGNEPPIGYTAVPMNRIHPSQLGEDLPPPKPDFSAPPPYDLATKLPSYEEVQREKTLQGELPLSPLTAVPPPHHHGHHRQQTLAFLAIDTEGGEADTENRLLGTDYIFCIAFMVAFLFNWIGFLLLMCFCHTVAARYGALSGFGLSLAKWTLIVKHSTELASHENSWLWWLIMTFGILICIRAIFQYLNIKRGWRLLSGSAQERLLFFY